MAQKIVSIHLQQAFLYHLTASKRKKNYYRYSFSWKKVVQFDTSFWREYKSFERSVGGP